MEVSAIAGEREGRIREQKDEATMCHVVAVDHRVVDRHRQLCAARSDRVDHDAEPLACPVVRPHDVGASLRQPVGVEGDVEGQDAVFPILNTGARFSTKARTASR